MKNWISRKSSSMTYELSHIADKNFLESSESLEISTRRSSISKIYNYPKKKYSFSKLFTKKKTRYLSQISTRRFVEKGEGAKESIR